MISRSFRRRRLIPGFGLTLGLTLFWLGLVVLIPVAALLFKVGHIGLADLYGHLIEPRGLAALRVSLTIALAAAFVDCVFGFIIAWVLVRHRFLGRSWLDAAINIPFALPTAVAGIALTAIYAPDGPIGQWLEPHGLRIAFTPLGIGIALVFIGLPFVVRSLQPVLADLDPEIEEAAACLGASRWLSFRKIVLPSLLPALAAGFGLAFARGIGEYGSVIFIAGNLPMVSEIAPLLIVIKLEEFDYGQASALAFALLLISGSILFLVNRLQSRLQHRALGRRP